MSNNITQQLGFEATSAIATLGRLKNALDGVNNSLATFVKVSQALRGGVAPLNQATQAAQALATAAAKAQTSLTGLGTAGANAGRQITLSWETVGRVVQTQVLLRGLNESIRLFQESGQAAAKYQVEIAKISNIAEGPGSDIESLTKSVRELAVELGRPLPEVSGAVYEALQNDLGTVAETFEILKTSANELARVTGGDLGQSVNALSSAIKSYNLNIDESKALGDKFFAAIDKGRITLEELESSLGTILPLARQAGVSFDEAVASFTAITRSGTTASVAITQVRNILQKVIKPTEEAQKVLKELGVRSFPELIKQSNGLVPALKRVFEQIGRDPERLAQVFNTIRGNLGALNLLADDTKEFSIVFDAITNSAGRAAEGVARIDGTQARKAEKVFNELNVILTELGEVSLGLKANLAQLFIGVVGDAENAKLLLTTFGVAVASTGAFALTSALSVNTLTASIVRLVFVLAGIAPAVAGIGTFVLTQKVIESATALDKAAVAAENLRRASVRLGQANIVGESERQVKQLSAAFVEVSKTTDEALRGVSTLFNKIVISSEEANNSILASSKSILSRFTAGTDSILSAVDSNISNISKRIDSANKSATNTAKELGEFTFERSLKGLSDKEEAMRRLSRAEEQLTRARAARSQAGISAESQELAASEEKYAAQLAREALAAAEKAKNKDLELRAENLVTKALTERFFGEKKAATALQEFNTQLARDRELQLVKEKNNLENLALTLQDLRNRFDKDGVAKSFEDIKINEQLAEEVEQKLKEGIERFNNNQVIKDLGLQGLAEQVSGELQKGIESTKVRWKLLADQLQQALAGRTFDASVQLIEKSSRPSPSPFVDKALQSDRRANPAEELQRQRQALLQVAEAGIRNNAVLEQGKVFLDSYDEGLRNVLNAANAFQINPVRGIAELFGFEKQAPLVADLSNKILELNRNINASGPSQYGQLFADLKQLSTEVSKSPLSADGATALNEALDQTATKLKTLQQQQELLSQPGSLDVIDATERLKEIEAGILALPPIDPEVRTQGFDEITNKLSQATTNAQNASTQIGTGISGAAGTASTAIGSLESSTNSLAAAAQRAAKAYEAMAVAAAKASRAGAAQNAYTGGKVTYRNAGGPMSRGLDSRLVSMQPGEMVVNQRQSRNFFSQLQAINAGQNPSFRNTGGSVTNIGDINVSVKSEGNVTAKTGRDIAQSLRRELRRGTSSLG
jgi:TP901 family phage tail tape measure protein